MQFNPSRKNIILGSIGILILTYVLYHLINGNRGIIAYTQLKTDLSINREVLQDLISNRVSLEHKVKLLDSRSMDLDLLEEYSRKNLGLSKPNEKIVVPNTK